MRIFEILVLLAAIFCSVPAKAQESPPEWDAVPMALGQREPDVVLTGTVDRSDFKRHLSLPFDVPKGVTRIGIAYDYSSADGRTGLNLGLFEGKRFRGWSGGNKKTVVIDETNATPSYLPGPVGGRRWTVDLGVSYISEGATSDYRVRIWFWREGQRPAVSTFSAAPLAKGARWYRGDFHLHTGHSDGFCNSVRGQRVPCPVFRVLETARAAHLDFAALTEHNNVATYQEARALQPYFDDLLIIPGREMTTKDGHANVFGITSFIDYRLGKPEAPDISHVVDQARRAGAAISINHPGSASNHKCRGCGWAGPDALYDRVDAMEVMTSGGISRQRDGDVAGRDILLWERQLAKGRRITAIGGSDAHDVDTGRLSVGYPTTMVRANDLSERAVLDGMKAGRVMIDMSGRMGIAFDLTARSDTQRGGVGDGFTLTKGDALAIEIALKGVSGRKLVGYLDGVVQPSLSIDRIADGDQRAKFAWIADGGRHWIRFEIRDGRKLLFLTNPVYVNFD